MKITILLFIFIFASSAEAFATAASSSDGASASSSSSSPPPSSSSPHQANTSGSNNRNDSSEIFGIKASWSSVDWNWGSPSGLGHDCALKCRQKFATKEQRRELVNSLLHADTDTQVLANFEDVKLVLALAWQRGRKFDPDMEAFGQMLDEMAELRYENGASSGSDGNNMDGDKLLVQDMQKRYIWLKPGEQIEEALSMQKRTS